MKELANAYADRLQYLCQLHDRYHGDVEKLRKYLFETTPNHIYPLLEADLKTFQYLLDEMPGFDEDKNIFVTRAGAAYLELHYTRFCHHKVEKSAITYGLPDKSLFKNPMDLFRYYFK